MRIYFNGDSHTFGSELRNPKETCYAYVLAKKINGTVVDNPARGGAGNDRILRLTNNYLNDCELGKDKFPDLIVIGWSEPSRFDWFVDGEDKTLGSGDIGLSQDRGLELDPNRVKFHNDFLAGDLSLLGITRYQHNQMYNLHLRLKHLKIPHLFFNAVSSFYEIFDNDYYKKVLSAAEYEREMSNRLIEFDWNNSFWKPYNIDGSFLTWGRNNDFKVTQQNHLEEKAHDVFSDHLISHLKFHKFI